MLWQKFKALTRKQKIILSTTLLLVIVGGSVAWLVYRNNSKIITTSNPQSGINVVEDIPQPLEKFEDFGLTVDKLGISAPIIPNVDGFNEKIYYAALKKGVGQFKDSTTPDKAGNLFIFGHSSWISGVEGKYTEIFKKLNELQEGDEFIVYYQKTPYRYRVIKSYLTNEKDWTLLDPTPDKKDDKTITLMTCWPPGTTTKRWGVVATQI